jgi:hypothetical protein
MPQRNLLYTGVTRGKRLVVLVGQKKVAAIAVRNISGRRRWSKLGEWLRPGAPSSRHTDHVGRERKSLRLATGYLSAARAVLFEQVLNILAAGHLRVGRDKVVL